MDKIDRILNEYRNNVIASEKKEEKLYAKSTEIEKFQDGIEGFIFRMNGRIQYRQEELTRNGAHNDYGTYQEVLEELCTECRKASGIFSEEYEKIKVEQKKVSEQREDLERKYRKDMNEAEGN